MTIDECGDAPGLPLFTARPWVLVGGLGASETAREVKPAKPAPTEGLELFQAAPAAEAEGYAAWKSEMAATKAAERARLRSMELPEHGGEEGFVRWKEDAEAARLAFERRWAVPLGKHVRVLLRGESREREGLLRVVQVAGGNTAGQLRLTLGGHTFVAGQIESLVRV